MSPEQARGLPVDKRADIWSFGVVFYEMLTGKRLYAGATTSDTLAALLKVEPDWNALPPEVPPRIRRLLRRCLTKDRRERLQAIGEARIEIAGYLADPVEAAGQSATRHRGQAETIVGRIRSSPDHCLGCSHLAAEARASLRQHLFVWKRRYRENLWDYS